MLRAKAISYLFSVGKEKSVYMHTEAPASPTKEPGGITFQETRAARVANPRNQDMLPNYSVGYINCSLNFKSGLSRNIIP